MSGPIEHLGEYVDEHAGEYVNAYEPLEGPTQIDNPAVSADDTGMVPGDTLPPPLTA
ncbi:hypothetical protein P8605_05940 [Streptomyces sp. T-3]|nr:hypothetical protein [Streptomyces sp. T-3]